MIKAVQKIIQKERIGYGCKTRLSECDNITANLMIVIMGAGEVGSSDVNIRGHGVHSLNGILRSYNGKCRVHTRALNNRVWICIHSVIYIYQVCYWWLEVV